VRGYVEGRVSPPVTSECRFLVYDASILPKKEILAFLTSSKPLPVLALGSASPSGLGFTYWVPPLK